MNRPKHTGGGGGGNARVNLVILQMEGGGETLTKGLESLVSAVQRSTGYTLVPTPRPPAVLGAAPSATTTDDEPQAGQQEALFPSEVQTREPTTPENDEPKQPTRARRYKMPETIQELWVEGADSFKSFVNGRSVEQDIDRGVMVAMWLLQRQVKEFDTRHMQTCFDMITGWKMPVDPPSLLRSMKKGGYVTSVTGKKGAYELCPKGKNRYTELAT